MPVRLYTDGTSKGLMKSGLCGASFAPREGPVCPLRKKRHRNGIVLLNLARSTLGASNEANVLVGLRIKGMTWEIKEIGAAACRYKLHLK